MRNKTYTKHSGMIFALSLLIAMIMSSIPLAVWADAGTVIGSGTCGTNLTWTLYETDDGMTLSISGSGSMDDYHSGESGGVPWFSYHADINEVIIEEGVTTIGMFAFNNFSNLHEIDLPDSLRTIKNYAFANSGLRQVTIPDGVTSLKFRAFHLNRSLESIVIPASVQSEQYDTRYSLDWCTGLKYIFYKGTSQKWATYGFGTINAAQPERFQFQDAIVHYNSSDHTYVHVDQVDASCESDGVKSHYECSVCKAVFEKNGDTYVETTEEDLVIKAAHQYGEWTTVQPATCEESGYKERACSGCEVKDTEVIEPLGHDWGAPEYTWAADNSSVTATRVCARDISHVEKETAGATSKVTKPATLTADGEKTYTATFENPAFKVQAKTVVIPASGYEPGRDPNQKGNDGTDVGPGASEACAEKAITGMTSDTDPKGALFSKLKLKSPNQTGNSITLKWTRVNGAAKYVLYGNKCGKTTRPKKLAVLSGSTKTFKKVAGKKLKKGTYYKFIIVAFDKNNNVVSTSKLIHVATKGGKVGNHKSVTVRKAVLTKAKALKKGKSLKLGAVMIPQSKKLTVKKHVDVRYESTNTGIATVSQKGVVKARAKGSCFVYAYAQNGVFRKIKVVVK